MEEDVASDRQLVVVRGGDGGAGGGVVGEVGESRGQLMMEDGDDGNQLDQVGGQIEKAVEVKDRVYRPGVWTLKETMVLLEAKKREKEVLVGTKRNSVPADEKWRAVAEFCWINNVHRSKEQCRFKWENTMPDFKKVREHEDARVEDQKSYFEMESAERKRYNLPPNLNKDLYTIMDEFLVRRPVKQQGPLLPASVKKEVREKPQNLTLVSPIASLEPPPGANFLPGEVALQDPFDADAIHVSPPRDQEKQENTLEQQQMVARGRVSSLSKASARKRRRKGQEFQEGREPEIGGPVPTGIVDTGAYAIPLLPTFSLQEATCPIDPARVENPSGSVLISELPRQLPPIQMLRSQEATQKTPVGGSEETLQETPNQNESRSEAGEEKSSSPNKSRKRGSASSRKGDIIGQSSPEQPTEGFQTPREGEKLPDPLAIIQKKKDARHQELVAIEREKLATNREAIALFASALNNMTTAVQKVVDLLQRK